MANFDTGLSACDAHFRLQSALAELQRAERNAVLWFAEIMGRKLYRELGCSSIHHYASEALGFSKSKTSQFIRLSESLDALPKLSKLLAAGEIPWTHAREVAKVASRQTEQRWIEEAKRSSRRDLERKVSIAKTRTISADSSNRLQASLLNDLVPPSGGSSRLKRGSADETRGRSGSQTEEDRLVELCRESRATLELRFTPEQYAQYEAILEKLRKLVSRRGVPMRRFNREEWLLSGLDTLLEKELNLMDSARDEASRPDPDLESRGKRKGDSPRAHPPFTRVNSCPEKVRSSPYQIVTFKCESCGQTLLKANRGDRAFHRASLSRLERDARIQNGKEHQRSGVHLPRSRWGSNGIENLVTLCSSCHQLAHERVTCLDRMLDMERMATQQSRTANAGGD